MNEKFIDEVMGLVDSYAEAVEESVKGGDFDSEDLATEQALYAAIRAKLREVVSEPLTPNEVSGICESAGYWPGDISKADFINGIRYAEMHHNIGAK